MHKIQGMTHKEIARQLGISNGAVEKHVAKAMLFLTEFTKGW
jgi:RNA polymerase sigma-70 factor (ECF subfamily)